MSLQILLQVGKNLTSFTYFKSLISMSQFLLQNLVSRVWEYSGVVERLQPVDIIVVVPLQRTQKETAAQLNFARTIWTGTALIRA